MILFEKIILTNYSVLELYFVSLIIISMFIFLILYRWEGIH